ncbi:hypothetical protein IGI04_030864 [Brassica rapa subsp. trilocularis]|uniref:Aminotransferase-like plant mobile domain-containing protein n=1 Tax=Brassica rapa subsp. trilocularis TaxID=1813537 RepID=A0ABQ7LUL9_BRACM|nr:hypothetical protein IGI04_030864 [Brassica rapa subsp. trilocularis]
MDSTSSHGNLVEEREELMVLPSENNTRPIIKKSHLLKPHVTTTIDGSAPSPGVKSSPLSVSFSGWRLPNQKFKSWFRKMSAFHKPIWIQSGIFEAIKASTHKIRKNPSLILSLSQKWNPETKTFVFPWGEATITLEDVTLLLGFSLLGSSVYTPLESSEIKESVLKLEKRRKESVKQVSWISSFEDDQMEHEAFLAFWLSNFVFPEKQGCSVSKHVFSVAVRLARGERIALAPAVLACLYRDLGKVNALSSSTQNVDVRSLFKLVQVWIWERFKSVGPRPGVIPNGEPRIARWSGLRQGAESVRPFLLDDFDWRPYTKPLRNWNPPRFYNEKAKRVSDDDDDEFACCVRSSTLDGFGFTEGYYPNRVALQFGLAQDLTGLATLDGSKQHIPSRLTTASVSAAKYRDWWMRSVKEPAETFNASNTGDDDDDDVPLKVLPLSQVFQKLGDGMKKAEQVTNKKRKQASEDENEIAMDCCQTQDEEDDDDNITIAQRIKCRKKCGDVKDIEEDCSLPGLPQKQKLASGDEHNSSDPNVDSGAVDEMEEDGNITIAQIIKLTKKCVNVENTEGGEYAYGGVEVDNNVPDLPQKLASGDETVAVPAIKKMSVENDETSSSDPLVASNRIAEKEEEVDVVVVVDDGRLNQRKLGTDEIALQLEARILKVEKTLAKIRQWKMGENQTKTPVSA